VAERIAVVGGWFAGLMAALSLARAGARVHLYEEHLRVGYPPHCTGVVSGTTLSILGRPGWRSVEGEYRALRVKYRGLTVVEALFEDGVYRVDRVSLEERLLDAAVSEGVEAFLGVRVESATPSGKVVSRKGSSFYDYIVLADGWRRPLSGPLGLGGYRLRLTGVNVVVPGGGGGDTIEVEAWTPYSPGFFAWKIPLPSGVLAGAASPRPRDAAGFVRSLGGEKLLVYGGQVVLGAPRGPIALGRLMAAGDAGGLTKPLTGGGLYPMAKAAAIAESMALSGRPLRPGEAFKAALARVAGELRRQEPVARAFQEDRSLLEALALLADEWGPLRVRLSRFDDHSLTQALAKAVSLAPQLLLRAYRRPAAIAALARAAAAALGLARSGRRDK
jgi:flavin-dependent dehydrogenase